MTEAQIYSCLQDAKYSLRKALEEIKKWDEKLGGDNTYEGEVKPIIEEVFGNMEDTL